MNSTATTTDSRAAAAPARAEGRAWLALYVLCAGMLMIVLDATIVNVALPSIQESLGFSQSNLAWVINAYMIPFGGLLLLAGRIGDLLGQRRVFLVGLTIFTAASLLCAASPVQAWLIGARFVQGIGGALASAVILGMIVTMFPHPADQAKAIGVYGFVASAGGSIGLLLGGVLTEAISWHFIFVVNLPIGALVGWLALRLVDDILAGGIRAHVAQVLRHGFAGDRHAIQMQQVLDPQLWIDARGPAGRRGERQRQEHARPNLGHHEEMALDAGPQRADQQQHAQIAHTQSAFAHQECERTPQHAERRDTEQAFSPGQAGQGADQPHGQRHPPVEDAARRVAPGAELALRRGIVPLAVVDAFDFGAVQLDVAGTAVRRIGKSAAPRRESDADQKRRGRRGGDEDQPGLPGLQPRKARRYRDSHLATACQSLPVMQG